jgi:phosphate transport system substrate-binding protein
MKNIVALFLLIGCVVMACQNQSASNHEDIDTPISGKIRVSVDETLTPIMTAQADIFQHQYPRAQLTVVERSENGCIQDLYKDSAKTIMIGRQLTAEENTAFQNLNFTPLQNKVCTDAIAFVVNPKNRDTTLTYDEVLSILRGGITNWAQLKGGATGDLTLVFDNANSGTVSYLLRLTGQSGLPKNAYAAKSNLDAVNYVAEHENALGVIGWSWISDSDDPKTRAYLQKTRLVSIAPKGGTEFYKPYQLNIAQGKYPLSREVYMIQRERRAGLASGFTTFVCNEIGQTIMLKAGLLPANQQDRYLEIKSKPIGKVSN